MRLQWYPPLAVSVGTPKVYTGAKLDRQSETDNKTPEMSATEAQLGLASGFEFELDLKFDDRVSPIRGTPFRVPGWGIIFPA